MVQIYHSVAFALVSLHMVVTLLALCVVATKSLLSVIPAPSRSFFIADFFSVLQNFRRDMVVGMTMRMEMIDFGFDFGWAAMHPPKCFFLRRNRY